MKKLIVLAFVALFGLTLNACGGSMCDDIEKYCDDCNPEADCAAAKEACETGTEDCTDDEMSTLESFVGCVTDLSCDDDGTGLAACMAADLAGLMTITCWDGDGLLDSSTDS